MYYILDPFGRLGQVQPEFVKQECEWLVGSGDRTQAQFGARVEREHHIHGMDLVHFEQELSCAGAKALG